jgi:hypothetical protein
MWNFFKKLFGGGKQKQTQIVGPGSVAIQTGNSINVVDIKTARSVSWEQASGLTEKQEEAVCRSMEEAGRQLQESQRKLLEKLAGGKPNPIKPLSPRGAPYMTPRPDHKPVATGGWNNDIRRAQQEYDAARERQRQQQRSDAIDYKSVELAKQRRIIAENEERLRRQRQQEADELIQSQLLNSNSNTNNSSYYTPPEPTRHECAPAHHSYHSYDSGHSYGHSCPTPDPSPSFDNNSSISTMD